MILWHPLGAHPTGDPSMFAVLIGATVAVAVADWVVIARENRRAEYVLKPLTMVILIAAAIVMEGPDPAAARWWVIAALLASLCGDVFLMLEDLFIPGLVSFLVAHLLYVGAFVAMGLEAMPFVLGAALVAVLIRVIGVKMIAGASRTDRTFGIAVAAYVSVISLMVAFAFGTTRWWVIIGALLFYISDAFIGWSRFVATFPQQRLAIMTTYHLGQIGLVLGLLGSP